MNSNLTKDKTDEARGRILRMVAILKQAFEGNERLFELQAACGIAQEPLWVIGDVGTGKTSMAEEFFQSFGLARGVKDGYFEKTLHPYVEPSEIFGPLDFQRLTGSTQSEYLRLTSGYLPSVRAAFLDEFSNAPQEILLTLLHILQHRAFHNGRNSEPSPLAVVVVASNEIPATKQLAALINRLPLRIVAENRTDTAARARVLQKSAKLWNDRINNRQIAQGQPHSGGMQSQVAPICQFDDFLTCLEAIKPDTNDDFRESPFLKSYVGFMEILGKHAYEIAVTNARTQLKVYLVMRALALLRRGDPQPCPEELRLLEHIFERPEAQQTIADELNHGEVPEWTYLPKS